MAGGRRLSGRNSRIMLTPEVDGRSLGHDVFQAIADPTRRAILELLAAEERSIAAIVERFPVSRTAVTKHLHVLAEVGLLESRRRGRETRYRARPLPLVEVARWVSWFDQYWDEKLNALIR